MQVIVDERDLIGLQQNVDVFFLQVFQIFVDPLTNIIDWRVHGRQLGTSVSASVWLNQAPVWAVEKAAAYQDAWNVTLKPLELLVEL